MDVTRKNFPEVLQGLDKVISESAFIAIDGEFTGLVNGTDVKAFDTTSEYYRKVREGSMKFLFVQFGLSAFKFNAEEKKWTHNTYNFYIFPRPYNRFIEDPRFTCQSSSIDFLASNGFDFNKLFKEGIPYLTEVEEEKQRKFLTDRHSKNNQNGSTPAKNNSAAPVTIPEEYEIFIAKTCSLIDDFLKSDQEELELERTSAFVRKLLYQTAEEKYPGVVRLDTRPTEDGSRVLFVRREGTEEERQERERKKQQLELQELDDAFGFSKVVRLLRTSGKLLIGHNMMLDVCHILNRFCSPLPYEYSDFKQIVTSTFPRLMDTKYIASSSPFKDLMKSTVLSDLYRTLSEEPFEMPAVESEVETMSFSSSTGKYHEAAYDAYITGMCFLTLARRLSVDLPNQDVSTLPLLKPYLNKLIVLRLQDIDHINLSGEDTVPDRDHVFHLTFPRDWRFSDILKLFSPFGNVYISWLDDTSAYVALYERDQAPYIMKKLPKSNQYHVVSYHKYHQVCLGSRVPSSPTTSVLRRRSQEKLQEAEAAAAEQAGGSRKRKSTGPARESKFSRRSIDTIVEEDDSNAGAILSLFLPRKPFEPIMLLIFISLHFVLFASLCLVCFQNNMGVYTSPFFVRSITAYLVTCGILMSVAFFCLAIALHLPNTIVSHWRWSAIISATCYILSLAVIVYHIFELIWFARPIPLEDFLHNPLFNVLLSGFVIFTIPMPFLFLNLTQPYLLPSHSPSS